ncbi:MAG: ATP-binding protein, partial [Dehalococcoidia bacterium]
MPGEAEDHDLLPDAPGRVKRLRTRLGLTQTGLAERLGVTYVTVSRWETGQSHPSAAAWRRILRVEAGDEEIFDDAGREQFGAAPSLPPLTNLPAPLSSFIGRDSEQAEIARLFATTRFLTLTGAGGSGKTRLAIEVGYRESGIGYRTERTGDREQAIGPGVRGEAQDEASAEPLRTLLSDTSDTRHPIPDSRPRFPDGVWLVELAALTDPILVPQAIASVLRLRQEPRRPLIQTLIDFVASKRMLLILDNCEHLNAACAAMAVGLLQACPSIHILATSREPLRVTGETTRQVPPLSLPAGVGYRVSGVGRGAEFLLPSESPDVAPSVATPDPRHPIPDTRSEAVRLFLERARAVRPDFALTDANSRAIAEICRRLDGLPLALELAAARISVLSVQQIAEGLNDRFRLLVGRSRPAVARHQTLRAAIDWSYVLLSDAEQHLFCHLSVFAGGFDLAAAEVVGDRGQGTGNRGQGREDGGQGTGVCPSLSADRRPTSVAAIDTSSPPASRVPHPTPVRHPTPDTRHPSTSSVLDLLQHLIEKSLVLVEETQGAARYRLLETVREYAREQLAVSGESEPARHRHAEHYLTLAEQAEPHLIDATQMHWLRRLEEDHGNLRTALAWFDGQHAAEPYVQLSVALWRFWHLQERLSEASGWLATALTYRQRIAPTLEAKVLGTAGMLAKELADYGRARILLEEGLALLRQLGDRPGIAAALSNLAGVAYEQSDFGRARDLYEESLALSREAGDRLRISSGLRDLGYVAHIQGDRSGARAFYEEGLALCREQGDAVTTTDFKNALGLLAFENDDNAAARAMFEANLTTCEALGYQYGVGLAHVNLAQVARRTGDFRDAHAHLCAVMRIAAAAGTPRGTSQQINFLATLAMDRGQPLRAARLMGAEATLIEAIGSGPNPWYRADFERAQAVSRELLGSPAFAAAWNEGATLPLERAIAYALE